LPVSGVVPSVSEVHVRRNGGLGGARSASTSMATRWLQCPRTPIRGHWRLSEGLRTMRGREVCGWSCTSLVRWPRPHRGEGHALRSGPSPASCETPRERALSPSASGAAHPTKFANVQSFSKLPNAVSISLTCQRRPINASSRRVTETSTPISIRLNAARASFSKAPRLSPSRVRT